VATLSTDPFRPFAGRDLLYETIKLGDFVICFLEAGDFFHAIIFYSIHSIHARFQSHLTKNFY